MRTAHIKYLAVAWLLAAALCGATSVPAAEKPSPNKPAAKAPTPAAKPAPAPVTPVPAAAIRAEEANSSDVIESDGKDSDAKGTAAGLPIPRFVSLRTSPINLRTGPGVRYPIDWVYVRRALPVEVIGEFDTWRHVRDHSGTEGWVHQTGLSGKRTAVVIGGAQTLKRTGDDTSDVVATLETGVIVNVQRCSAEVTFCRVEVEGAQGWLKREQLWGVYPGEVVQ